MSCWRKSESACPTDPVNNPEREGDRLLSTAIYFSCRLITNLLYFPSARSCKRTNPRLFSIPHFSPQNIDIERIRTTASLRSGGSLVRSPDSPPCISYIRTPTNLQALHSSIADCGQAQIFSITKAARRYSADRYKRKYIKTESSLNEALIITIKDECHIYFRRLSVFAGSLAAKDPTYLIACPGVNIVMITSPVAVVK